MTQATQPPEALGSLFRRTRQQRGVSIAEVAEATKISEHYLVAIEEEDWDLFPAEAYRRGFLRNYARFLALDEPKVLGLYGLDHSASMPSEPSDIDFSEILTARPPRQIGLPLLGLTLLLLLLGVYAYFSWRSPVPPDESYPASAVAPAPLLPVEPVAGSEVPGADPVKPREVVSVPEVPASSPQLDLSAVIPDQEATLQSQLRSLKVETPVAEPESSSLVPVAAAPAPVLPAATGDSLSAPVDSPKTGPLTGPAVFTGGTLFIKALSEAEVTVVIDGRPPRDYQLLKGSALSWKVARELELNVSDPAVVEARLEGQPIDFGSGTRWLLESPR